MDDWFIEDENRRREISSVTLNAMSLPFLFTTVALNDNFPSSELKATEFVQPAFSPVTGINTAHYLGSLVKRLRTDIVP